MEDDTQDETQEIVTFYKIILYTFIEYILLNFLIYDLIVTNFTGRSVGSRRYRRNESAAHRNRRRRRHEVAFLFIMFSFVQLF